MRAASYDELLAAYLAVCRRRIDVIAKLVVQAREEREADFQETLTLARILASEIEEARAKLEQGRGCSTWAGVIRGDLPGSRN